MLILVTGGFGMLGRAITEQLLLHGHQVRVLDLENLATVDVEIIIGNVTDFDTVLKACEGVDAVIHTASLVSQELGQPQILYDVNVSGTENIIRACQQQSVKKLVYTSSIDVVFDGTPISNGDETLPYPAKHLDYYGTTKMLAEKAVINANGVDGLATASIRSAGIYGPYDKHRFPAVISQTLTGQFTKIGDGTAKFTHVYVENLAHAHVLLVEALELNAVSAGEIYFITDYAASNFFDFFLPYLDALDIEYRIQTIPLVLAQTIANVLEFRHKIWQTDKTGFIQLSRYTVASVATDFWFNHNKATQDFGYEPLVSEQEAFERTLSWLKNIWLPSFDTDIY
ncbi:MAG: NAD-dependent epimerase/dehydratase family protein [Phototrophicaceae bacterium]